ncbi:MAG: hypothetical protein OEZ16_00125 [Chromatiales bacterium]|nr:hypothetical protein [Chromatiales bacterium]
MKYLIALSLALLLSGCTTKPNDEMIAQQVTQQRLQQYGDHIFEVINFRKVNGFPRSDNNYEAEVEYDLRFLIDLKDVTASSDNIISAGIETAALSLAYGNFKQGDIIHKKERVKFILSEKGWMIDPQK